MSDFLGSLVARSLNLQANLADGNILRPRLPSMFEAPAGDLPPAPPAAIEDTGAKEAEVRSPVGPPRTSRNDQRPSPGPRERPVHMPPSIPTERLPVGDIASPSAGRGVTEDCPAQEARPGQGESWRTAQRPPAARETRGIPVVVTVAKHDPTSPAQSSARVQSAGAKSARPDEPALLPLQKSVHPERERAAGLSGSTTGPAPGRGERIQTESAPSAVRIHIGRIEVRAVAPPPVPARKQVPFRPKLSLDDYLRRRDGGRR
jgi:hypothetical protein